MAWIIIAAFAWYGLGWIGPLWARRAFLEDFGTVPGDEAWGTDDWVMSAVTAVAGPFGSFAVYVGVSWARKEDK